MKAAEVAQAMKAIQARAHEAAEKARLPDEQRELLEVLLMLVEMHLVNQARIADSLGSLVIHVRSST